MKIAKHCLSCGKDWAGQYAVELTPPGVTACVVLCLACTKKLGKIESLSHYAQFYFQHKQAPQFADKEAWSSIHQAVLCNLRHIVKGEIHPSEYSRGTGPSNHCYFSSVGIMDLRHGKFI